MAGRPPLIGSPLTRCIVTLAVAAIGTAVTASAQTQVRTRGQAPAGADTLSPAAIADSLAVLRSLDSLVRREPNHAAAWYRRGMVAWALAYRDTIPPPVRETDWTLLGRMADTSLRRAALAEPANPFYHLMVGRYLLSSGNSMARTGANVHFERSAEAARTIDDPWLRAETMVEVGRIHWRRYDQFADRMPTTTGALRSLAQAANVDGVALGSLKVVVDAARLASRTVRTERAGEADYVRAETSFREAYETYPAHVRAFRNYAMLLAEKERWTELSALARDKIARTPWDYLGWMSLGLAQHRLGANAAATAAFDSAMTYIPDDEYRRLDRLERILRQRDTLVSGMRDPELRASTTRLYWMLADPLWSRDGNETRIEFLARVTFAELRWTVDDLGVRGADTDRGDVHVRYGPPDVKIAWGPEPDEPGFEGRSLATLWTYEKTDQVFVFQGQLGFATARFPLSDRMYQEQQREEIPVRWDNAVTVTVDTIPTQAVRFRGIADSVDGWCGGDQHIVIRDVRVVREAGRRRATRRRDSRIGKHRRPCAHRLLAHGRRYDRRAPRLGGGLRRRGAVVAPPGQRRNVPVPGRGQRRRGDAGRTRDCGARG